MLFRLFRNKFIILIDLNILRLVAIDFFFRITHENICWPQLQTPGRSV